MAMTKKEQVEVAELRKQLGMARALSWPNFPKPTPLAKPGQGEPEIHGWEQNSYAHRVWERWSSGHSTYDEPPDPSGKYKHRNGTQGMPRLYATERDAWLAMFHEVAEECAARLAKILQAAN